MGARMAKAKKQATLFSSEDTVAEGNGRIRPRARLLRTIGAELISSEVVAVIELARNCYDADATAVELVFDHPEDPERATLEIRDDGHGITREVLLGPWLEPATNHKSRDGLGETAGERSPGGRRRLGSKGVGRFAAQRLGDSLKLMTRAEGSITELSAWFEWRELEEGKYLDEVRIPWREHHPTELEGHGTHLKISKLRNRWTPDRFEKLKLGLSRLLSPTIEGEFKIQITVNGSIEDIKPAVELQDAMYTVHGTMDQAGSCILHYSDINGAEEVWERTVLWPGDQAQACGPFTFRIGAWDLDSIPLRHFIQVTGKKLGIRDLKKAIRDHSGIALYRDGFRILPYGEPDNDWLRLDRRRVNNPTMRLSNNQILGTIQLTADENPLLSDQTNREGLVSNEAYSHLQDVVLELLGYLETRRFAARRAMDVDWTAKGSSLPAFDGEGKAGVESLLTSISMAGGADEERIEELRQAFEKAQEGSLDAVRTYGGLTAAGRLAAVAFDHLGGPIRRIRDGFDLARDELAHASSVAEMSVVLENLDDALQKLDNLEKKLGSLRPVLSETRGRRVQEIQIAEALSPVLDIYEDAFDRLGIALDRVLKPGITVRTNREIAGQVLAVLVDNALHWAQHGDTKSPIITVRANPKGFTVSDTGPGVAEGIRGVIFEPHFTTRDGAHGLGLTLARDLLKGIGGRIWVPGGAATKFVVELSVD
jgi:signal transduction histidine kinase